ncbi:MAG TPA: putative sulfate exporter family transporter [Acidimicrobiia bacterium]|nr:putative sulfate exporter family transporter [Acidimicrobiia bacterium]
MTSATTGAKTFLPGVIVACVLAGIALLVSAVLPPVVSPVLVAVVLGLALANLIDMPAETRHGLDFAAKRVLRWGVVLLGAKLSLGDVVAIGQIGLGVVALCMITAFTIVAVAARAFRVPPRLSILLAVGTAVCGNSAIVATAPVVDADEKEIGVAVGTITVFGTVALLLFPVIGHAVGMADTVFGFWAGLSINDTSQVVAAGAAHSPQALETATVVKLVRNTLMAPLIILLYWWSRRTRATATEATEALGAARGAFPLFVLGFLALAALRSVGVIDAEAASVLATGSTVLITVAIAAVGASVKLSHLRTVGAKPFLVGFAASAGLAVMGVTLAHFVA